MTDGEQGDFNRTYSGIAPLFDFFQEDFPEISVDAFTELIDFDDTLEIFFD